MLQWAQKNRREGRQAMMGITHMFAGTVSALLLTEPGSPGSCLAALVGGSLGGIVCDIDLGKRNHPSDARHARRLACAIVLACFAADRFLGGELLRSIRSGRNDAFTAGLFGLALLWIWGRRQPHRGGTHSLLALVMFGGCVRLVCGMLTGPFLIGMASHLALDLLNRRPLMLLYPLPAGVCLGLCNADGALDRFLRAAGLWGTIFAVGFRMGVPG